MNVEADVTEPDIARIAAGDRAAFAALYRRYRPDVYRFVAHMTGVSAVAEDIVQDVFLDVMQQAHRYDPSRGGVAGWLIGIARNHVRRWQHRRRWHSLTGLGTDEAAWVPPDALDAVTRAQDEMALEQALLDLPARYREVIVLCDLQELPYDQAAAVLRCKVGTIRSRLHRGRARLARALKTNRSPMACRTAISKVL